MNGDMVMCSGNMQDIITRLRSLYVVINLIRNSTLESPAADALYSALDTLKHIEMDLVADFENAFEGDLDTNVKEERA